MADDLWTLLQPQRDAVSALYTKHRGNARAHAEISRLAQEHFRIAAEQYEMRKQAEAREARPVKRVKVKEWGYKVNYQFTDEPKTATEAWAKASFDERMELLDKRVKVDRGPLGEMPSKRDRIIDLGEHLHVFNFGGQRAGKDQASGTITLEPGVDYERGPIT